MATGRSDYPEPGEQRPRLPVHLPRRARRARQRDQRGDEDGRGAGARRSSRARTCPEPVLQGVRGGPPPVRARVPHPQAVRPARAALGGTGGGEGGHGERRRAEADCGPAGVPRRRSSAIMGPSREVMQLVMHKAQSQQPQRIVFPEGEDETIIRAGASDRRRAHRAAHPARAPRGRRAAHRGAAASRCTTTTIVDIERSAGARRVRRPALPAARAQRHDARAARSSACSTRPSSR